VIHLMKRPPFLIHGIMAAIFSLVASIPTTAGAAIIDLDTFVSDQAPAHVHNREFTTSNEGGRRVVRANAAEGEGLAWWDDLQFSTGTIECDLRGRNNPGASFVGLMFHGVDVETYEAVYFRPFNFNSTNPEQHNHAVQYISQPDFPWQLLREKRPGVFENKVEPAPEPDGWFHVRIVVETKKISVFVGDAAQPCLVVIPPVGRTSGWAGLWVGNNSDGAFANLKIKPDVCNEMP
jgi:hypothetical protein